MYLIHSLFLLFLSALFAPLAYCSIEELKAVDISPSVYKELEMMVYQVVGYPNFQTDSVQLHFIQYLGMLCTICHNYGPYLGFRQLFADFLFPDSYTLCALIVTFVCVAGIVKAVPYSLPGAIKTILTLPDMGRLYWQSVYYSIFFQVVSSWTSSLYLPEDSVMSFLRDIYIFEQIDLESDMYLLHSGYFISLSYIIVHLLRQFVLHNQDGFRVSEKLENPFSDCNIFNIVGNVASFLSILSHKAVHVIFGEPDDRQLTAKELWTSSDFLMYIPVVIAVLSNTPFLPKEYFFANLTFMCVFMGLVVCIKPLTQTVPSALVLGLVSAVLFSEATGLYVSLAVFTVLFVAHLFTWESVLGHETLKSLFKELNSFLKDVIVPPSLMDTAFGLKVLEATLIPLIMLYISACFQEAENSAICTVAPLGALACIVLSDILRFSVFQKGKFVNSLGDHFANVLVILKLILSFSAIVASSAYAPRVGVATALCVSHLVLVSAKSIKIEFDVRKWFPKPATIEPPPANPPPAPPANPQPDVPPAPPADPNPTPAQPDAPPNPNPLANPQPNPDPPSSGSSS